MHTPEPSSGAARYVMDLVKQLCVAGEPVVLLCPRNFAYSAEASGVGATLAPAGDRSTKTAGLPGRIARNLRFFVATCFRQALLTRPEDIVHFQFPLYFPAGLAFFALAKIQARGIIYTAHDPVPHKWLLPRRLRFIERASLRCAYSLSDRIIVHNPAARELIVRVFGQAPPKIAVIPHGCSALEPSTVSFRESDTLELLLFGSIREDKGIELAIEAVQKVNAQGVRVRLLIAGAVANAREQAYWSACKSNIQRASAGITVLEEFIPDAHVPVLLAACHAVLLPYKHFESDSGVAAVALAGGRAILATYTGSLATLLDASDLGIPIRTASVAAVEHAIRAALADGSEELRNKGLRGLAFARSALSWESAGKKTANLYRELQTPPMGASREDKHGGSSREPAK